MNTIEAQDIGQENKVMLCGSCCHVLPNCEKNNIIYGTGVGSDNIIACDGYEAIAFRDPSDIGQEL